MGQRAHKVMKIGPVQQLLSLEAPPSPLSSRPERSAVEGPAVSKHLNLLTVRFRGFENPLPCTMDWLGFVSLGFGRGSKV
jgi:hypothetical protein